MPACAEKKKERKRPSTDILDLKQSMTLWPLSCHSGKHAVAEPGKAKQPKQTGKTDYVTHHILVIHSLNTSRNTWLSATPQGMT